MVTHVAWIDDTRLLTVEIKDSTLLPNTNERPTIYWAEAGRFFKTRLESNSDSSSVKIIFYEELPMGEELILKWGDMNIPIYPRAIVRTNWFDEHYSALNAKLGAKCENDITNFSIWAPTATSVILYLNNNRHVLNRQQNGVWTLIIHRNLHGLEYDYEVMINGKVIRVNDPYAKAMLANSTKSVIVDFSKTDRNVSKRPMVQHLQDAIIYELHVRDATSHNESGIVDKGTFSGLTEINTHTKSSYTTGLSYMKELGFTHVQLLPINDFARVNELHPKEGYNWGYDPLFFQVPEGSYSLTPTDPIARINECKQMIHAFHQVGISVILDVVYNHVFIMDESVFEKLVPGYYFRYHIDGTLSNGTGVGNDFASERKMARKFILDTIELWLKEYNVDGFRFDLMGATDIETMQAIQERCAKEIVPIMLLGEGWNLPTALNDEKKALSSNSQHLAEIRFFNDYFRDSLKGNLFDHNDTGYVNGNGRFNERMSHLVTGSTLNVYGEPFVSEVSQTINYVECHDNHTLWDRLLITNKQVNDSDRKKMHQLATGITLLSQGVPFIHAGQEWFRTKQGDENSYTSGDEINQLDWNKRELENDNIEFIKTLISLRKKYDVFRLRSNDEIRKRFHFLNTPEPVFGFALFGNDEDFSIYVNPTKNFYELQLPSSGTWQISATNDFHRKQQQVKGEFTTIEPYELIVLKKPR
ncbi:type I pullulanase [Bacillus sp. FSL K6-3431]|uniref:type I pullulanase n=1 Tax=Bacillus sp. FSL K6-3431 TaxID=2921500 RepID=UPI0030F88DB1